MVMKGVTAEISNSSACDRPYIHFKFVILSVMNFCSLTCNSDGTGPGFMLFAIE